jgi:hypothetical protein
VIALASLAFAGVASAAGGGAYRAHARGTVPITVTTKPIPLPRAYPKRRGHQVEAPESHSSRPEFEPRELGGTRHCANQDVLVGAAALSLT